MNTLILKAPRKLLVFNGERFLTITCIDSNLEVLMLMKSLESRGFVRITFSWQYNYCYLTDEGIDYLRRYLALPPEIVPATHKKTATRPAMHDTERFGNDRPGGFRGDREYRSGGGGGGFGRGGGI